MKRPILVLALITPSFACSWVARPEPPAGCESDDDCASNEICSIDQGGVCLLKASPPRRVLAFDVTEQASQFRAEINACETDLVDFDDESLLLTVDRDEIGQRFDLRASDVRPGLGCTQFTGCPPNYSCDVDLDLCISAFNSTLALAQASRIGFDPVVSDKKSYPTTDEEDTPLPEVPVPFEWARYEGIADVPLVSLSVDPLAENRARFRRMVVGEPDERVHDLIAAGQFLCHRDVTGVVRRVGGSPVLGSTATLAFAEPVATASTLLSALDPTPCSGDDECEASQSCNLDAAVCGLDLTGERAGEGTSDESGNFEAWIYSYCEDGPVSQRSFTVDVAPTDVSGLPRMRFDLDLDLPLPQLDPNELIVPQAALPADLCLPDWPSPDAISFEFGAPPVTLATTEAGTDWKCCDAACLPAGKVLADEAPQPPSTCLDYGSLRIRTPVAAPDAQEWEDAGCLPLDVDEDGNAGEFVRFVNKEDDCNAQGCVALLPPDEDEDDPRLFQVAVVHPMTSVFRSRIYQMQIDPFTQTLDAINFSPRTILRGEIVCAEDTENCTATEAVIVAERLRMPDEGGPLGPYFFWQVAYATSEDDDGQPRGARFALPLNPGVYVVTALPASGAGGGPASYFVVDVRNDAAGVTGGLVKTLELEDPIELEAGLPVRLQLRDFDRGAQVRPIDTGSWVSQDAFTRPGEQEPLDLNDPATCYGTEAGRGCQIRSLTRPDVPRLSLLQSKRVQFSARDRGAKGCPAGE